MADPNPNPSKITDALWQLWLACLSFIPGVRLGGIYANKSCYHNTVQANQTSWPGAYCIRLALDLVGLLDKARAIDLTMSTTEMIKRTGYLKASALDPRDDRLKGMREFIGTLDGKNVTCYIKDDEDGPWRFDGGRDSSHLWHIHISIFTKYCGIWDMVLEAVASVLSGESYDAWLARKGLGGVLGTMMCEYGDGQGADEWGQPRDEKTKIVYALQCVIRLFDWKDPEGGGPIIIDGMYRGQVARAIKSLGWAGYDQSGNRFMWEEWANMLRAVAQRFGGGGSGGLVPHTHTVGGGNVTIDLPPIDPPPVVLAIPSGSTGPAKAS